jgi:hypothetical protein
MKPKKTQNINEKGLDAPFYLYYVWDKSYINYGRMTMIEIDGILYDADDYYYWEHLQACLSEMENDDD